MKKINWRILITTSIICILPILLGVICYNCVPEQIAIHFDISNNPNLYMSKNMVLFGFPIILGILQAVLCFISDMQKVEKNYIPKVEYIYKSILPILIIVAYSITLETSLGIEFDIRKIIVFLIGFIFLILENYIPKASASYTYGIYPKFLTSNQKLWKRINKTLGYSFVFFGILLIISIFLPNVYSAYAIIMTIVVLLAQILYYIFTAKSQI